MSPDLERVESLKAGAIAALVATTVHTAGLLLRQATPPDLVQWGVSEAIALLVGGLFGVTYRYIVRQDNNPQLKSGAVLAFALVRGLSQIEHSLGALALDAEQIGLLAESLGMFAAAQIVLNGLLQRGWVKPFEQESR
jgi:hypothetical protein